MPFKDYTYFSKKDNFRNCHKFIKGDEEFCSAQPAGKFFYRLDGFSLWQQGCSSMFPEIASIGMLLVPGSNALLSAAYF